jgi:predicted transcriptional regulator
MRGGMAETGGNMKAVLISIRPERVEKIINESPLGRKNVEIRKTRPKLKCPFKCFIYCAKARSDKEVLTPCNDHTDVLNGKVLGEFICDEIIPVNAANYGQLYAMWNPRMSDEQLDKYLGFWGGYGWHISDLVVYDKSLELADFTPYCDNMDEEGGCLFRKTQCDSQYFDCNPDRSLNMVICERRLRRPPQSWCYVLDAT